MKNFLTRVLTLVLSLSLVAGLGVAGYLAYLNFVPAPPTAPTVEVRSIQPVGNSLTVALTVRGKNLARAELWADNNLVGRENNPNPALPSPWNLVFRWTPPTDGAYTLAARIFDQTGAYNGVSFFSLVVPPKNKLVFSSNRGGAYALYTMTADGTGAAPLAGAGQARQANVSREGALAYASMENGAWHIRVRPAGSNTSTDITPDIGSAQHPVWSADGKRVAFEVVDGSKTNIIISDPEGKNRTPLTQTDGYNGQVTFSPANNLIAFASLQGTAWDVYSVQFDGSNLSRLTNDGAQDWQPAWSPKGDRIAFVSNRSGSSQVYVMNPDGTNVTRLTDIPGGADQPAWSADGKWIVFVAATGDGDKDNRRELYLMSADGKGLTRLTQDGFDDTEPAWMP